MQDLCLRGATRSGGAVDRSHVLRPQQFYVDVLGATVYREYGGTSCVLTFLGGWLLLVTGGEPTRDKPDVSFTPPVTWGAEIRGFFRTNTAPVYFFGPPRLRCSSIL